jgi:hypothetical protein
MVWYDAGAVKAQIDCLRSGVRCGFGACPEVLVDQQCAPGNNLLGGMGSREERWPTLGNTKVKRSDSRWAVLTARFVVVVGASVFPLPQQ